jgi:6-phosphogluconolactonase
LAHTPHGTEAEHSLYTFRLNEHTGDLTLLSIMTDKCNNPAFMRYHPSNNLLYICTESISENGIVMAFSVSPTTGQLSLLSSQSANGTSTCYLTIDNDSKHLLYVNYWDSTIGTLPLSHIGLLNQPVSQILAPPNPIKKTKREDHLSSRQSEDHAHAIVLDPVVGLVAYVPDLGRDCIKVCRRSLMLLLDLHCTGAVE